MSSNDKRGLVLGVYEGEKEGELAFSKAAQGFQASKANRLSELLQLSGLGEKKGKCRVFHGLDGSDYPSVAVVLVGKKGVGYNELEEVEEGRENIRTAVAAGVKQLHEYGVKQINIDPCGDAEAAAEAATLCTYVYDELKKEKKPQPDVKCFADFADNQANVQAAWKRGTILGEGQNLARRLMESPANVMTPTRFGEIAQEKIGCLDNCTVTVRDKAWAEQMKMGSYLSVSHGSEEPPKFVEVSYKGGKEGDRPFALVGKGITFDSGGISLKPPPAMDEMRADMGGGACVLSSIYTAARLRVPLNIMAFIPLTENLVSGKATKPGDVVTAMNGKTIQVDNTDAEGRLVLADALCYAQTFNPTGIVDMATLTGAMVVALGAGASGVFTNSSTLWQTMHKAGTKTGDRVWRMPLFNLYTNFVRESKLADIVNTTKGVCGLAGGSCTAAAFLREFVNHDHWMHMDIAGVMSNKSEVPYLTKGMAGRPTRTVVEFLNAISQQKL